jgi:hypothetical protein
MIKLGDRLFKGPYHSIKDIKNKKGIYLVLRYADDAIIEVNSSSNIQMELKDNSKISQWDHICGFGQYYFAAVYLEDMPILERISLANDLRSALTAYGLVA